MTQRELRDRRRQLLNEAPMSEEDLRRGAASYILTPEQAALLDEIDRIDYLLGVWA
jgi:hypothetical protein